MKKFIFLSLSAIFCLVALTSCSSSMFSARGAAVGGVGASLGYSIVGWVSSESEAQSLARQKGYSRYIYDSETGMVMGK